MSVRVRLTGSKAECERLATVLHQHLPPFGSIVEASGWRESRTRTRPNRERQGIGRMAVTVLLPETGEAIE